MTSVEREEVVAPLPDTFREMPTAVECRSTLLMASIQAVEHRGLIDDYRRAIDAKALEAITSSVAAVWLPIGLASAHYRACDTLGLTAQQVMDAGGEVVHKLQQTFLGTILKTARTAGAVDPWIGIGKFHQIHARSFHGGGARVLKIGPKDARIEVVGIPLASIPYFRISYRGFLRAGMQVFTNRVFCTDLTSHHTDTTMAFRVAWA